MGELLSTWDDDDIDLYPERPREATGTRTGTGTGTGTSTGTRTGTGTESRTPLVVGWVAAGVSSAMNIALLAGLVSTPLGDPLTVITLLLVPVAVLVITLCGTFSTRDRRLITVAGLVLLGSPFAGSMLAGIHSAGMFGS